MQDELSVIVPIRLPSEKPAFADNCLFVMFKSLDKGIDGQIERKINVDFEKERFTFTF